MDGSLLQVRHILTFWKDGFSVDDGPLRTGESPEDKKFIDFVRKGSVGAVLPFRNLSSP